MLCVETLKKGKHSILTCSLSVKDYWKLETSNYKTYTSEYLDYSFSNLNHTMPNNSNFLLLTQFELKVLVEYKLPLGNISENLRVFGI